MNRRNPDAEQKAAAAVLIFAGGVVLGILLTANGLIGGDYLTGAATLLLVLVGSVTFWMTHEARTRAQAELVASWPEHWKWNGDDRAYEPFEAIVGNGSPQPIYAVNIALMPADWPKETKAIVTRHIGVILPGHEGDPVPMPRLPGKMRLTAHGGVLPGPPPVRIEFYDAAGRRWRRDPDGVLTRLPLTSAEKQMTQEDSKP